MMTPINRIPKIDSDLRESIAAEMERGIGNRPTQSYLAELAGVSGNSEHADIALDWAMEIRNTFGISWAECIDLAMTLYFG